MADEPIRITGPGRRGRDAGSTGFWPNRSGRGRSAQRLIESGRVRVDGAVRPQAARRCGRRARSRSIRAALPMTRRSEADGPVRGRLRGRVPARGRQARRAWSSTRPGAIAPGRWRRPWRGRPRAATNPGGPGSSTGSIATPRGCSSWRGPTMSTGGSRRCWPRARCSASTSRSSTAIRRSRTGTIDAPIGRDRRDRLSDVDRHRRAARGADPLRGRGAAADGDAAAGHARDGPDPSDPRPSGRDRACRVAGDPQYGVPGRYGLERQFLHAAAPRRSSTASRPATGRRRARSELPRGPARRASELAPAGRAVGGGGPSTAAPPHANQTRESPGGLA